MSGRRPILPGATIGILGGGQLGRMTAMAARSLGYHIQTLDPDPSCAARFVVDRCITAPFDDEGAAAELAKGCQVVTLEIEKISLAALAAAEAHAPVRPGPALLAMIQDRGEQKAWLAKKGFPLGPWERADDPISLRAAVDKLAGKTFVKATRGGYDGGGQVQTRSGNDAESAFSELGHVPVVVERALSLQAELSVLVARSPSGEVAVYEPSLNHHEERILEWSVLPGPFAPEVRERAKEIAREIARETALEGILVIELFLLADGSLLVNELAPRPHNSFHSTEVGCVTSQFEQHVRAVCDLPLGSTESIRPAAVVNLLGDLWGDAKTLHFDRALEHPDVRLHLYGKRVARPRRKMGHLSATAGTPEEAVRKVLAAKRALEEAGPVR